MKRRWIIRSIFMLPILLCLIGWGWSGWYVCSVSYLQQDGRCDACNSGSGLITVEGFISGDDTLPTGWKCKITPDEGSGWFWQQDGVHGFLGFFYVNNFDGPEPLLYRLDIPYWFLVLYFSILLVLVYRKTRPKPNPATAFPVEMDKMPK